MVTCNNLLNNPNLKPIEQKGSFTVLEYQRDLSVSPSTSVNSYYMSEMGIRRKQVLAQLNETSIITQAGAMQWTTGSVGATTGIKGVGDFLGKALKGKATGESTIKPEYVGKGMLMLEPTYKYILLEDISEWGSGMVIEDGLFMACEGTVKQSVVAKNTFSSAAFGNEGLFNMVLRGNGIAVLESNVPREELILFDLSDDVLKIDGSMAIAWSDSLKFTVERSGKSLIGSAASGEGLVNVYRGTGKVLMSPVALTSSLMAAAH
ncbi:MAG: AIM24 family protein [Lachnospiraceae bacterium]|nr:AIM24 family protein [Lachnospiraceae bacterium]